MPLLHGNAVRFNTLRGYGWQGLDCVVDGLSEGGPGSRTQDAGNGFDFRAADSFRNFPLKLVSIHYIDDIVSLLYLQGYL